MQNIKIKFFFFFLSFIFSIHWANAQKVGLVLSGGGASGLAHIGVIKALEKNNIPIDYITGTSIGALIGSFYSMGYTPEEIENLMTSDKFKNWSKGVVENKYVYYFKKKEENSSWVTFKLSFDSTFETNLPTNLISPLAIDFGMMELAAGASAASNYNFDSLFIPFRCVASDIENKQSYVFKNGDLGEAVRASMSYPFYLKPVTFEDKLLFDGGIYNNFPSDIMFKDFFPDIIIGSNVTNNVPSPTEDNLISQLKTMLLTKTNYNISCENGIIIEPSADIGLFDFSNPQKLIDSGYAATLRKMPLLQAAITRRVDEDLLNKKRKNFTSKIPPLNFNKVNIQGLTKNQSNYAQKLLLPNKKIISVEKFKSNYFRLAEDDKIKNIFPKATYNFQEKYYDLLLKIKKEKDFFLQVGGNFSNRPISEGFVGAQYNYLGKTALSIVGNTYFGKLYNSAQIRVRFDFPTKIKFYIEPTFTANQWDFFKSSNSTFFIDTRPSYLIQKDQFGELNIGLPTGSKSKLVLSSELSNTINKYYQTDQFLEKDTADKTSFGALSSSILFERNSLNRKLYANQGSYASIKLRVIHGEEYNLPGSTSITRNPFRKIHEWVILKGIFDNYFLNTSNYKAGVYIEGVISNQPFFNNYIASILSAPAFQPIPETKTIFQENYRAHQYGAIGLKNIITIKKNIDIRLETYLYQPYQEIKKSDNLKALYSLPFTKRFIIATAALVVNTPLGPLSASVNYYSEEKTQLTFLFHFGYILFNRRALD